jgi:hypothetical protein
MMIGLFLLKTGFRLSTGTKDIGTRKDLRKLFMVILTFSICFFRAMIVRKFDNASNSGKFGDA